MSKIAGLRNDVYNRIRPLLAEVLGAEPDEIDWETNVYDDLNADVLEFHDEVISLLEETFGIAIADEDVADLTTLRSLVDYVAENM
jgi:acyl carrier protein